MKRNPSIDEALAAGRAIFAEFGDETGGQRVALKPHTTIAAIREREELLYKSGLEMIDAGVARIQRAADMGHRDAKKFLRGF